MTADQFTLSPRFPVAPLGPLLPAEPWKEIYQSHKNQRIALFRVHLSLSIKARLGA